MAGFRGRQRPLLRAVLPLRTPSFTWAEARDAAAAASFMGVAGQLATITSDQFIGDRFRNPSFQMWIGGVQSPGAATPANG